MNLIKIKIMKFDSFFLLRKIKKIFKLLFTNQVTNKLFKTNYDFKKILLLS
jgi:hypothetical protein